MAKIRVLRLVEYTYADVETMEADMARWTINQTVFNSKISMKSVALPLEVLKDDDGT